MPTVHRSKSAVVKPRGAAKREALTLAFRRRTVRQEAAEEQARVRSEAKLEARHKRAVSRRERTSTLAAERLRACQRHPSPHAVEQLASIAGNHTISVIIRVEAARELLRIGFGKEIDVSGDKCQRPA